MIWQNGFINKSFNIKKLKIEDQICLTAKGQMCIMTHSVKQQGNYNGNVYRPSSAEPHARRNNETKPEACGSAWSALLGALLLSACSPSPLTDEQVRMVVARCAETGQATRIFNSSIVSTADCVPVEKKP